MSKFNLGGAGYHIQVGSFGSAVTTFTTSTPEFTFTTAGSHFEPLSSHFLSPCTQLHRRQDCASSGIKSCFRRNGFLRSNSGQLLQGCLGSCSMRKGWISLSDGKVPYSRLAPASTTVATTDNSSTMFPAMPTVPVNLASQELSSTTSTTTTTTVTTNTTTTITSGFNLYFKPPSAWPNGTGLVNVASLPSTMTVNSIVTPVMTYGRLESVVDKWHLHLRNQEKHFLYQANQLNVWNHTLIENRDEIALLHHEVEKVKLDQSRLERELDFILAQQKELEHLLTPLEEFVKEQNGPFNLLYFDKEYEKIYKLAENIDAELKRMSQDVKDIIVHLNSLGSPGDAAEPLQQICKMLNAHMDSLQWICQNSGIMQKTVKEVTKAFEEYRLKEQERSMKFAFE